MTELSDSEPRSSADTILVTTAAAAIAGDKVGERYHRKVDRVGLGRD